MTSIWRLNIKTAATGGVDPRKFCIDRGLLGIGWALEYSGEVSKETYLSEAERFYGSAGPNADNGWWPAINAIANRMSVNDLCWTRDTNGVYYLGRVLSDWVYQTAFDFVEADVVNTRECSWVRVGAVDAVPGKVVNSFIPRRTVQRVNDDSVAAYSKFLYNTLSQTGVYSLDDGTSDLLKLISSDDCEDLVGLYLQERGYRMIASSCKSDTAAYEFVMKHRDTGETAVAQVKQGDVTHYVDEYLGFPGTVFLFTTSGRYVGNPAANVYCIDPDEIRCFLRENAKLLSDRVTEWVRLAVAIDRQAALRETPIL